MQFLTGEMLLHFIINNNCFKVSKKNMKEKEHWWVASISDVRSHYKTNVIKSLWSWSFNKYTYYRNKYRTSRN